VFVKEILPLFQEQLLTSSSCHHCLCSDMSGTDKIAAFVIAPLAFFTSEIGAITTASTKVSSKNKQKLPRTLTVSNALQHVLPSFPPTPPNCNYDSRQNGKQARTWKLFHCTSMFHTLELRLLYPRINRDHLRPIGSLYMCNMVTLFYKWTY
jgi:hypothetical protein